MSQDKDVFWINPRPVLTIEHGGGAALGNCYNGSTYVITCTHALDQEEIKAIRAAGFIGYGQEFHIRGQHVDGRLVPVPLKLTWEQYKERAEITPSGVDRGIPPVVKDRRTGKLLDEPPTNWKGDPVTGTMDYRYYIYITEDRVDSSG